MIIPKETICGRSSFSISFYVFGIDVENNEIENKALFLDFYNEANGLIYFSFSNKNYIVDSVPKYY